MSFKGYLGFVDRYFTVLFDYVKPLLYANGGPIISVQVSSFKLCHKNSAISLNQFIWL